jgi:Rieske Fe-S protein
MIENMQNSAYQSRGHTFDPFANGKVVQGPARDSLSAVKVKIEGNWVVLA